MSYTAKLFSTIFLCFAAMSFVAGCTDSSSDTPAETDGFEVKNLVADDAQFSPKLIDPQMINAWGLAFGPTGFPWIANAGTGFSTFYDLDSPVTKIGTVQIPSTALPHSPVIGIVFNPTTGFQVGGTKANFIFATAEGALAAWRAGDMAATVVHPANDSAAYTGLALLGNTLYAANFKMGRVDMFDNTYQWIGSFTDATVPAGYAPFNVQEIDGQIYVSFALREGDEEAVGAGLGFIDRFTDRGVTMQRIVSQGNLNAPWGMVKSNAAFGKFDGDLLVGNFGDGHINVYSTSGDFKGQLEDETGKPIMIEGLWALMFSPDPDEAGDLYFTAAPDDETHGIFGEIELEE
jgi:uncharacterized protein (TIGR03118 family)